MEGLPTKALCLQAIVDKRALTSKCFGHASGLAAVSTVWTCSFDRLPVLSLIGIDASTCCLNVFSRHIHTAFSNKMIAYITLFELSYVM